MESPKKKGLCTRLAEETYTYIAFWSAAAALPVLAISYVVVRVCKHLWLKLLSSRYPHLEFIRADTIRSLLDTHRNQGIINVLLSVKGTPNIDSIKQELSRHVLDRLDSNGDYMFPRLRHQLVSCWGNYAWDVNVPFRCENHVIFSNAVYRGRPVSESNIQDYVSEIVSKYFPSEHPPWQYYVIPFVSEEPKYYILVRVHHLLLTGKKSFNIGDLLMIDQMKTSEIQCDQTEYSIQSPLSKLFPTPSAIPELFEKLNELLSNAWNEYISEYDPVESARAHKTMPGVFHVAGIVMMALVSAFREESKKRYRDKLSRAPVTPVVLLEAIMRQNKRRNLTLAKIVLSPLVTLDPRKWPKLAIGSLIAVTRLLFKLPGTISDEIAALSELKRTGLVRRPNTLTWKYGGLVQLAARAGKEAFYGLLEIYRAPIKLYTDTLRYDDGQRHVLQTVSLCGRKVAAWSKPVSRQSIERTARALGVSATDIHLFATTEALRAYFEQSRHPTPEAILTTARAATEDFLFTFAEGDGKNYKKSQTGGMVCLSLPVGATPRRIASVVENACNRQHALAAAWTAQAKYGALTRSVPSPFARLTLNLLSRRYAVSYAEINSPLVTQPRTTLWGQTLDSVLYWRPPQANISMSLTVMQYADSVRLAIMTDSRLTPGHTIPAIRWSNAIHQLVNKVDQELAKINVQTRQDIPRIIESKLDDTENEEIHTSTPSTSMLKPPSTQIVSPPPTRKRLAFSFE